MADYVPRNKRGKRKAPQKKGGEFSLGRKRAIISILAKRFQKPKFLTYPGYRV